MKFYQHSSWNSISILHEILSIFFAKHYGPKGEPACSKLTTHTVVSSARPHVAIQSLPIKCFQEEKIVPNNVSKNFKYIMLKNWEVKILIIFNKNIKRNNLIYSVIKVFNWSLWLENQNNCKRVEWEYSRQMLVIINWLYIRSKVKNK